MNPDEKLFSDLRDKIKSKMDVAKLLGTFLTGLLSVILAFVGDLEKIKKIGTEHCVMCFGDLTWNQWLPPSTYKYALILSVAVIFVAIVLYFATVFAYDRLLMPQLPWLGSNVSPRRLHGKMVYSWQRYFIPATAFAGSGVFLLAFTLLRLGFLEALLILGTVGLALFYCHFLRDDAVTD